MKRPLHALYLQTTPARQEESVDALMRIIARTFPDADARLLIVDNALDSPCERHVAPNVTLIDGDNRGREFTGLDRGIAWLRSKGEPRDDAIMLIANDTLLRDKEATDFFRLDGGFVLRQLDRSRILGHVDCLVAPIEVFGNSIDHWVRFNFVLCTYGVLKQLAPLSLPYEDADIFSDSPAEFFRPGVGLSETYRVFLKAFLQGQPNAALWRWHSARPIGADNFAAFRSKAKAIICEHYLSGQAKRKGFELVDISRRHIPSKEVRARIRRFLYNTSTWRLVPRFRRRFASSPPAR